MVIKIDPEIMKDVKATDQRAVLLLLKDMDKQLIRSLKVQREDVRFVQGFSAAVDQILSLITKQ